MKRQDYSGLSRAFQAGLIIVPDDIFKYVEKNRLFRDAGLPAYAWGNRRLKNPFHFKVGEIQQLANVIGINWKDLIEFLVTNAENEMSPPKRALTRGRRPGETIL